MANSKSKRPKLNGLEKHGRPRQKLSGVEKNAMIYPTCPKVKEVTKSGKTFPFLGVERVCATDQIPEELLYELQEKPKTSDEPPDIGSNTVPEHMNDPKSENWTKYGNVYGISNESPILTQGSTHKKRFIGPNMDTEDKDGYTYDSTGRYALVKLIDKFKKPKIMPYPTFTS